MQKGIVVIAGIIPLSFPICKRMAPCPRNFQKLLFFLRFFNAILHHPCQVPCRSGMHPCIAFAVCGRSIQPIRRNKKGIEAADVFCLLVHHCRKPFDTAPDMLRNCHCRIVMGFQHKGIKQILHPELLPLIHAKVYLRLAGRIGRNGDHVIHIAVL